MALVWPPPHFFVKPNVLESLTLFPPASYFQKNFGTEFFIIILLLLVQIWVIHLYESLVDRRRQDWLFCQHGGSSPLDRDTASKYFHGATAKNFFSIYIHQGRIKFKIKSTLVSLLTLLECTSYSPKFHYRLLTNLYYIRPNNGFNLL